MKTFECKECNFHYGTEELARRCEEYCKKYKSCSLEITKHAIEMSETATLNLPASARSKRAVSEHAQNTPRAKAHGGFDSMK